MNLLKGKAGFITGNLIYYAVAHLFIFLSGFIRIPILTSIFFPHELGAYSWCVALLAYLDIILFSWVSATLWRYVYHKEAPASFSQLLAAILPMMGVALGVAAFIIAVIAGAFIPEREKSWLLVTGFLAIASQQFLSIYFLYLQSQKKISRWCRAVVSQQLIGFLLLLLFVFVFNAGINSIFLSALTFNVFFCLLKFFKTKNVFRWHVPVKFNSSIRKAIATYSYLAILLNCCLMLLNNGDRFLISYIKGDENLGLYAQSYSLASVGIYAAIQAFNTIIAPAYNHALAHKEQAGINRIVIKIYILFFTPALMFLLLNSRTLTEIVLAPAYHGYHQVFSFAATGIYFYGLCHFLEVRLKFQNKAKLVLSILAVVVFLNILLNAIYLRLADVTLSAIISFGCYQLLLLILLFYNRSFIKQLRIMVLIKDLFISSLIVTGFHFMLLQTPLVLHPIFNLAADFLLAVLIYYYYLKKYVPLVLVFLKRVI